MRGESAVRACAVLIVAMALAACVRDSADKNRAGSTKSTPQPAHAQGASAMLQVETAGAASAATRLLLSPKGGYALAEIGGEWRDQAFLRGEKIPPVLKLIERQSGKLVATAAGWALGPPGDECAGSGERSRGELRQRGAGAAELCLGARV